MSARRCTDGRGTCSPLCRSLTGDGVRTTLQYVQGLLPGLRADTGADRHPRVRLDGSRRVEHPRRVCRGRDRPPDHRLPSPATCTSSGTRSRSTRVMSLEELQPHLHSLPGQPDAIPYGSPTTSAAGASAWRIASAMRSPAGRLRAVIDSTLAPGQPRPTPTSCSRARRRRGPLLHVRAATRRWPTTSCRASRHCALARWLRQRRSALHVPRYFGPETIGALVYLSRHLDRLRERLIAGYVVTCCGDEDACRSCRPARGARSRTASPARAHPPGRRHRVLDFDRRERRAPVLLARLRSARRLADALEVRGVPGVPHVAGRPDEDLARGAGRHV